ncbi:MAG: hydrogenase [Lentisphaerota bacterium]
MTPLINTLLVIVLALNLYALGASRIAALIRAVTLQGVLMGLLLILSHQHAGYTTWLAAIVTILIKGLVIPRMLNRAMRDVQIQREVEPLIGFLPSLMLGAVATGFALIFASALPLSAEHTTPLLVPASLSTMFIGFILLTTRVKAIVQVIGYLVLENGIFIFGVMLVEAMPLVVELGVLLDLFVAIFVICIIVNHVNRTFSSLDTRRLTTLKE